MSIRGVYKLSPDILPNKSNVLILNLFDLILTSDKFTGLFELKYLLKNDHISCL